MAVQKPYHFKKIRQAGIKKVYEVPAPGIIIGEALQPVPDNLGSSLEAMIYRALLYVGWLPGQIEVQTPILGGRNPRGGGQILDFVLYKPLATPIRSHGDWWHRDKDEDFEKDHRVREYFGRDPIIIWGHECSKNGSQVYDFDQTVATVLRLVGRP